MRLFILFMLAFNVCLGQELILWKGIQSGPHAVGFKEQGKYDDSRTFGELPQRPIQMAMWYPATPNTGDNPMIIEDYFQLEFREVDFTKTTITDSMKSSMLNRLIRHDAEPFKLEQLLNSKTKAVVNSKPTDGKFPMILFVQGGGRPARSAFLLSEYLASHGFVVVTMPHIGSETQRPDSGMKRYLTQVADMEYVISEMETLPFVDSEHLFLFSFSTAAESLFIYQSKTKKAKAIVTLDGTPNMQLMDELVGFNQNEIDVPLLFIKSNHGAKMTLEVAKADNELEPLFSRSERTSIRMMKMNHPDLLSIGLMEAYVPKLTRFEPLGEKVKSHQVLYESIRTFLTESGSSNSVSLGDHYKLPEDLALIKFYDAN